MLLTLVTQRCKPLHTLGTTASEQQIINFWEILKWEEISQEHKKSYTMIVIIRNFRDNSNWERPLILIAPQWIPRIYLLFVVCLPFLLMFKIPHTKIFLHFISRTSIMWGKLDWQKMIRLVGHIAEGANEPGFTSSQNTRLNSMPYWLLYKFIHRQCCIVDITIYCTLSASFEVFQIQWHTLLFWYIIAIQRSRVHL